MTKEEHAKVLAALMRPFITTYEEQKLWEEACAIMRKEPEPISDAEPYDQQALELCDKCGWKTLIPGDGCLNCARNLAISDAEIFDIAGNYDCGTNGENMEWAFQSPKELLDFARALLEKAK